MSTNVNEKPLENPWNFLHRRPEPNIRWFLRSKFALPILLLVHAHLMFFRHTIKTPNPANMKREREQTQPRSRDDASPHTRSAFPVVIRSCQSWCEWHAGDMLAAWLASCKWCEQARPFLSTWAGCAWKVARRENAIRSWQETQELGQNRKHQETRHFIVSSALGICLLRLPSGVVSLSRTETGR